MHRAQTASRAALGLAVVRLDHALHEGDVATLTEQRNARRDSGGVDLGVGVEHEHVRGSTHGPAAVLPGAVPRIGRVARDTSPALLRAFPGSVRAVVHDDDVGEAHDPRGRVETAIEHRCAVVRNHHDVDAHRCPARKSR